MREYDVGIGRTGLLAVIAAVIVGVSLVSLSIMVPFQPTTTTITTTTTTTNGTGFGPLAADYLNSRRDDVQFYWIYNCTFVNQELSDYYDDFHTGAYVDGVFMKRQTGTTLIEVLFSPWTENIKGTGSLTITEWDSLSGQLVDDGIGLMADASSDPDAFQPAWPPTLNMEIFFDDLTFFSVRYHSGEGVVFIGNGTWTGSFMESGWPQVTGYSSDGYWLYEGGHLTSPMQALFDAITTNASYPT